MWLERELSGCFIELEKEKQKRVCRWMSIMCAECFDFTNTAYLI